MYIAVLMDASGSMSDSIEEVRRAAIRSLGETPRSTYFMVFRFSDERTSALPDGNIMTQERAEAEEAIRQIVADGNTCLYDSIIGSVQDLRREVPEDAARRALIVFTDGIDARMLPDGSTERCSTDNLTDAVAEARISGNRPGQVPVPVYMIGLCNAESVSNPCTHTEEIVEDNTSRQVNPLNYLAGETGAIAATGTLQDISNSFDQIMDRLNSQWLAYAPVPARQNQNEASLEVYLNGSTTPLVAPFSFVSDRDYRTAEAGPMVGIASQPRARYSDDTYELPLRIENADDIEQITVTVIDSVSNTELETAHTMLDRAAIAEGIQGSEGELLVQINAADFVVDTDYIFVVSATDSAGQNITRQGMDGDETELGRTTVTHQSDIVFSVTAGAQIERDFIELEIEMDHSVDENLSYIVEVEDAEIGRQIGDIHGELAREEFVNNIANILIEKDASPDHFDILDYIQRNSESRSYVFTVRLWKESDPPAQAITESDEQTIAPIGFWAQVMGMLFSPWTLGIGLVSTVVVIGSSMYMRRRKRRKPTPPPLHNPVTDIQFVDMPRRSGHVMQGQVSLRVRLIKTRNTPQQNKESVHTTPFTIGRGEDDAVRILGDKQISRAHVKISSAQDAFVVTDNSTNGTYINDQRLERGQPSKPLTRCTKVQLGSYTHIELDLQQ